MCQKELLLRPNSVEGDLKSSSAIRLEIVKSSDKVGSQLFTDRSHDARNIARRISRETEVRRLSVARARYQLDDLSLDIGHFNTEVLRFGPRAVALSHDTEQRCSVPT